MYDSYAIHKSCFLIQARLFSHGVDLKHALRENYSLMNIKNYNISLRC